jgi:hypothetical protein
VVAFLTGFFAVIIFGSNGKLIGALTQVVPLILTVSAVSFRAKLPENSAIWAAVGVVPAILGAMCGVLFSKRFIAILLNSAGVISIVGFGLWGFDLSLEIAS